MIGMLDFDQAFSFVFAGVVALIGTASCIAWLPAIRYEPAGLLSRMFMTTGVAIAIIDLSGVGSVLGLSLAAMGGFIAWAGQPAPDVPRPRRCGLSGSAAATGWIALVMIEGWGPLAQVPDELRAVASVVAASAGVLVTFAIADRARVLLRDTIHDRLEA
jgi:hypothetical protein